MEYKIEIVEYGKLPELSEQKKDVILVGRTGDMDECIRMFCFCEKKTPLYFPLGKANHEGGSSTPRRLIWVKKDEILTIDPSIKVLSDCFCHFHVIENRAV